MEIIKPGTNIDFVGKRYIASGVSALMVLASIVLFFVKGPNWGIDFTGGTEVTIDFNDDHQVDIAEVRTVLEGLGVSGDAVQQAGDADQKIFVIRIQDPTFGTEGLRQDIESELRQEFGQDWITESSFDVQVGARLTVRYAGAPVSAERIRTAIEDKVEGATVNESPDDNTVYIKAPGLGQQIGKTVLAAFGGEQVGEVVSAETIGPRVGGDLRQQGFIAIAATLALVLVYVAFRFDLAFAPGAVLALFHDVTVVVGIFTITGHEFNLSMIGALLTIVGYSLNDTIVIYDRIRENMRRYRRKDTAKLINDSVNETLGRTIGTGATTIVAMSAFLFLGGPVIETFALAIMLGVIFGTYSTVYVASPMILVMEDLKPHLSKIFAPLAQKGAAAKTVDPEAAAADEQALTEAQRRRKERKERRDARSDAAS